MRRYVVFGYGYNPNLPTCFVNASGIDEAWVLAREALSGRTVVTNVIESPSL